MRLTIVAAVWLLMGPATSQTLAPEAAPGGITVRAQGHGWILGNAEGMTLYTYVNDQKFAAPTCEGDCTVNWSPLLASADAKHSGEWCLVTRKDGARQWSFLGKPLYTYSRDVSPGDMNGDELAQQWYVATKSIPTPPGFTAFKTPAGYLLVDQKKMTLYTSDKDKADASSCEDTCAKTWKPVEAWWLATSTIPDWTILTRKDGTRQWVFKGKPLYRYAGDFSPGELAGARIKGWQAVVLEPPPPVPSWITYQASDGGELLADAKGQTLYAHDLSKPRVGLAATGRDIERPDLWKPVLAQPSDTPIGNWSIVARAGDERQWAYKGMPLYVNLRDQEPGDLNGVRSTDRVWRTIMKSGQTMAGTGN